MTPRLWGWVVILVVATAYEVWGILDPNPNDTLSELTRRTVGLGGTWGRWAFIVLWGVLAAWFVPHIVEGLKRKKASK